MELKGHKLTRHFKTEHGSELHVNDRITVVSLDFDWFEEPNACIECSPEPYPDKDDGEYWLTWHCEDCGGGRAKLTEISVQGE
jgi:hypothetical protein